MNFSERDEAAHEQTRGHEQRQRKRNLENNDGVTQAAMAKSAANTLPAITEGIVQVAPRGLQGRKEAKDERGQRSYPQRKEENRSVEPDYCFRRNNFLRYDCDEGLEASPSKQCAEARAADRQKEAFHKQLADEPPAARSESGANGELFFASGGAGKEQVGHVAAADQQQQPDGRQDDEKRHAEASNN